MHGKHEHACNTQVIMRAMHVVRVLRVTHTHTHTCNGVVDVVCGLRVEHVICGMCHACQV